MSIASHCWPLFRAAGLAGLLSWTAAGGPATATEAATAIASPAARADASGACHASPPRFEPMQAARAAPEAVKTAGGAILRSLVAAPCPQAPHAFDI
jgi:hypothetical protein